MGRLAFVFPGQGAEVPAMGLALASHHPPAQAYLDLASELTGEDLPRLLKRGGRRLRDTALLQPALTAVCLGALDRLRSLGVRADLVAGHSLGELGAWAATGTVIPETIIALAATRGKIMSAQASRRPGEMAAISDISEATLGQLLHEVQEQGPLAVAAHNGPSEWVISGTSEAIAAVAQRRPVRRLTTSGPWHSPLMMDAMAPWQDALTNVDQALATDAQSDHKAAFVANATGRICPHEELPAALAGQLVAPVRWAQTVQTLIDAGVTDIVCVGPSRIMRGLLRYNVPRHIRLFSAEEQRPYELDALPESLSQATSG